MLPDHFAVSSHALRSFSPAPRAYVLFLVVLSGAVVHGCANALHYLDVCLMVSDMPNTSVTPCSFSAWLGGFSWIYGCIGLLYILKLWEPWEKIIARETTAMCEFLFASVWSMCWLVLFCVVCNAWRKAKVQCKAESWSPLCKFNHVYANSGAVCAFAFFSVVAWITLSFLAFKRWRDPAARGYKDDTQDYGAPYTSQQAPESGAADANAAGYQGDVAEI